MLRSLWRTGKLLSLVLAFDLHLYLIGNADLRTRSHQRKLWSQRILDAMGVHLTVHGQPPQQGVVIGNHLSYLDILTYGAVMEGVFVSKIEVRSWPLIGSITKNAGSIYVDRARRQSLGTVNAAVAEALRDGLPVTFFPEGTSTNGESVLRFHPALFQAPVEANAALWPAAITYRINGKSEGVADQVCYWGDMTLGPHLLNFLKLRNVTAELRFAEKPLHASDRVEAAQVTQAAVAALAGLPAATKKFSVTDAAVSATAMQSSPAAS